MSRRDDALRRSGIDRARSKIISDFIELFVRWNRKINLSAASSHDEIEDHVVDSLHILAHVAPAARVLDVGSGGGFPVVIAAICLPDVQFTALEPVHKKHAFLRTAARELSLHNLDALAVRLDDHEPRDYDLATSRATFDLGVWLELGLASVHPGGRVIGFEAIQRDDLPVPVERHRYEIAGKPRALVVATRS